MTKSALRLSPQPINYNFRNFNKNYIYNYCSGAVWTSIISHQHPHAIGVCMIFNGMTANLQR